MSRSDARADRALAHSLTTAPRVFFSSFPARPLTPPPRTTESVDEMSSSSSSRASAHARRGGGGGGEEDVQGAVRPDSPPMVTEADGIRAIFPKEARLRNLTYSAPLYVDMTKTVTVSAAEDKTEEVEKINKVFIGKVPIMPLQVLPLPTTAQGAHRARRVRLRRGRLLHHQRIREGSHRAREDEHQPRVRLREAPAEQVHVGGGARSSPESGARAASSCMARLMHRRLQGQPA